MKRNKGLFLKYCKSPTVENFLLEPVSSSKRQAILLPEVNFEKKLSQKMPLPLKTLQLKEKSGFSFIELIAAALILGVCSVPILWLTTSTRTETSKGINYLRGIELAQEALDWAQVIPFEDLNGNDLNRLCNAYSESLFGNRIFRTGSNAQWLQVPLANDLSYSEQYDTAYFFRQIKAEDLPEPKYKNLLKKITVCVSWNEGVVPANPSSSPPDRMKKIVMSTLVYNDKKVDF
ncbi:MAG: hypothetical protein HQM08_25760 [Candidatus Riflebacteria bacterium]|nr:hypothetical protein [Candidatus Riflebacteria bacterium]